MDKFRRKHVVRYFKKSKLPRLKDLAIIQEGPACHMKAWEAHYQSIGTPYALTSERISNGNGRSITNYQIWKRRVG